MTVATGPARTEALVAGIRSLGAYKVIVLEAPEVARTARPGQFVNIGLEPESSHLLRRPFSIYRAHAEEGLVEIAFDVIGPGTQWIAARRACTSLDIVGPLGHGFTPPEHDGAAIMAGGGYGASALFEIGRELRNQGRETTLITGAATASRVFGSTESTGCFDEVIVTTDDGSAGRAGFVTDALSDVIRTSKPAAVYACGPMPMLAAVSKAAHDIPVQVATEEFMACGLGVCWTCVVPVRTPDGVKHLRGCTEGPVFDGAAVEWR